MKDEEIEETEDLEEAEDEESEEEQEGTAPAPADGEGEVESSLEELIAKKEDRKPVEEEEEDDSVLTVEREESLDGSHRTPLGVPLGERLQLLDKPLRFREAALDFLIQGHRILRRAAPRTSASA